MFELGDIVYPISGDAKGWEDAANNWQEFSSSNPKSIYFIVLGHTIATEGMFRYQVITTHFDAMWYQQEQEELVEYIRENLDMLKEFADSFGRLQHIMDYYQERNLQAFHFNHGTIIGENERNRLAKDNLDKL